MSSPSFFNIGIIDVNPESNLLSDVPMADLSRAFFICWQEYSTEGIPLDEETTTGVELRGGSLTPLGCFIPAILQNPLVIRNIRNDPRIGGLKLVVYEVYQEAVLFCKHKDCPLIHPKSAKVAGRSRSKWLLRGSMLDLSRTMYPFRNAYGISSLYNLHYVTCVSEDIGVLPY
ncbi:hypothetical protein N7522_010559 [Penicillium canescens]|uniref:Uncharacterized protein n=1 Tax=Penicillium canescens TaxID=5083 RepID=A0AAD6NCE5_PENCN|nr:uncharacterized protein N7446_006155 [Penicillium canescens]KAJ5990352.1 hypothetical protein N7522_010559 [Penicillium canescens]KAJ6051523.1 hypothetical protein N7460_002057 [Penicillium canescens]KAJ6062035.1 hypothetical protein N7446_006155 [Penicillium canescens]KAJ6065285.1 hypothetical protein N7444_000938 [Penicillium canescens]